MCCWCDLLLDDDENFVNSLKTRISQLGYNCVATSDYEEAINILELKE